MDQIFMIFYNQVSFMIKILAFYVAIGQVFII